MCLFSKISERKERKTNETTRLEKISYHIIQIFLTFHFIFISSRPIQTHRKRVRIDSVSPLLCKIGYCIWKVTIREREIVWRGRKGISFFLFLLSVICFLSVILVVAIFASKIRFIFVVSICQSNLGVMFVVAILVWVIFFFLWFFFLLAFVLSGITLSYSHSLVRFGPVETVAVRPGFRYSSWWTVMVYNN